MSAKYNDCAKFCQQAFFWGLNGIPAANFCR